MRRRETLPVRLAIGEVVAADGERTPGAGAVGMSGLLAPSEGLDDIASHEHSAHPFTHLAEDPGL